MYRNKIPVLPGFISRIIRVIFSCDLSVGTQIGEGTKLVHNGLGCVINPEVIIGNNVRIYQNVSLAGRNNRGVPVIEDDVFIGAGACVLGGVTVGKGASIGANAVVLKDVKPYTTVVGIPAKEI